MTRNEEILTRAAQEASFALRAKAKENSFTSMRGVGPKDMFGNLLGAVNVSGKGNEQFMDGRVGLNNVPITDNFRASVGASGYYSPKMGVNEFNNYDAAMNLRLGEQRQHEFNLMAQGLNKANPYYKLNYGSNWGKQKQHTFGVSVEGMSGQGPRYGMNYGYRF